MKEEEIVIVSAARTPVGSFNGALASLPAHTLGEVANTDLLAGVSEEVMKSIVGQIPVGRLGEADEVARCVVFLAADEAAWITGSTLTINGGQFMD
jgi:NAD(P)-dependent dehydrogenase (short-subunit alcohol dehydrogenase family)